MSPIIATVGSSGTSTPAPEGMHQAVCVDVIDKGMVEMPGYDGKPAKKKHMISIAWQIEELRDDGKRFVIYRRYALSLNEKASLRKDLESWRGRKFSRDEEMGFDVEKLIGANCLLNVQHNTKGEQTYANVMSVVPLLKGMPKIAAVGYVREEPVASNGNGQAADDDAPNHTDDDIPF